VHGVKVLEEGHGMALVPLELDIAAICVDSLRGELQLQESQDIYSFGLPDVPHGTG